MKEVQEDADGEEVKVRGGWAAWGWNSGKEVGWTTSLVRTGNNYGVNGLMSAGFGIIVINECD